MFDFTKIENVDPALARDILEELGEKNTVRVFVTRAGKKPELLSDSRVDDDAMTVMHTPIMIEADRLRVSNGLKPIYTEEIMRRRDMELVGFSRNLRTTVGIDYCAVQLGGSASATVAKYIAVSNNTNAPAAANTSGNTNTARICWGTATSTDAASSTSRGEYTALGFARAAASYAHTGGVASYSQTITFTATSAATNLQCCGIFDNSAQGSGTLFCENTYTPTTFATNDQLTIAWTFNI